MAKPGATQQPCSAAQHSHKFQYKYLNFKIYFLGYASGGCKTCLTPPQNSFHNLVLCEVFHGPSLGVGLAMETITTDDDVVDGKLVKNKNPIQRVR